MTLMVMLLYCREEHYESTLQAMYEFERDWNAYCKRYESIAETEKQSTFFVITKTMIKQVRNVMLKYTTTF